MLSGTQQGSWECHGNLDLIIANGHPDDLIEKIYDNVMYREPLLLHNHSRGPKQMGVVHADREVIKKLVSSPSRGVYLRHRFVLETNSHSFNRKL
ncbi:MAG: hypothetical protein WBV69_22280 [Candidatus Sulfotelmatobacter sp.]